LIETPIVPSVILTHFIRVSSVLISGLYFFMKVTHTKRHRALILVISGKKKVRQMPDLKC